MNNKAIEVDQEFKDHLNIFMLEGYSTYPGSDKQGVLYRQESLINETLTALLEDNDHASRLFREYQDNRDTIDGENSATCYKRGFTNGIKFMMEILK